jgi:hypothetical protein
MLLGSFFLIQKDTNRHPVNGILTDKFIDNEWDRHFVITGEHETWVIDRVPQPAYNKYNIGDNITVMIRGHQYRYIGDVR